MHSFRRWTASFMLAILNLIIFHLCKMMPYSSSVPRDTPYMMMIHHVQKLSEVRTWDGLSDIFFSLTRALLGPYIFHHLMGRGSWDPPLTRLLGHVATRNKRHSNERQINNKKLLVIFLGQVKGHVTKGHQMSNLAYFNIISRPIFDKLALAHNSVTRRVLRKSAFESSFNALSLPCLQIWSKINGLDSTEEKLPKVVFNEKHFFR